MTRLLSQELARTCQDFRAANLIGNLVDGAQTHGRGPPRADRTRTASWVTPDVWVTWRDAATYAVWCGKLLPNSARWEKAARGLLGYEAGLILGVANAPLLYEA